MKQFIILIDYKAGSLKPYDYIKTRCKDIVEAIEIAETFFEKNIYLIHILEKTGNTKIIGGIPTTTYTGKMTKRECTTGWHPTTNKYGEQKCKVVECKYKDFTNYDIII